MNGVRLIIKHSKKHIACVLLLFTSMSNAQLSLRTETPETTNAVENNTVNQVLENTLSSRPKLPRVETQQCAFSIQYDQYDAECGTLFVQENPLAENTPDNPARVVTIPIMIFQPAGEVRGDPVVITGGGGPGSSIYIIDDFDGDPSMYYSGIEASTLQNGRPLVVMEMRGSGLSMANLDCPAITDLDIESLTTYPYEWNIDEHLKLIGICAKRKKSLGVDANFYNTDYAIQDIDTLRHLLGFEQWHLLGISHGTRISLRYAQKYPERAASLILDSIYPFELDSYVDLPRLNQQIFTQPFALCDADPRCRLESGEASITLFDAFMAKIKATPPVLNVEYLDDSWNLSQKTLKLSPELLAYALFNATYDSERIFEFPYIIKDAMNQDYSKLSGLISETIDLQNFTWFSEGAYASYACYEEIPFSDYTLASKNAIKYKSDYWDDLPLIIADQQICRLWDIKPATNDIKRVDHSQFTLPILILAGDLDPFTPSIWAIDFLAKLPMRNKTQHVRTWPFKAHNLVYEDDCVDSVITSFLNAPEYTIENDCAVTDVSKVTLKHDEQEKSTLSDSTE